MKILDFIRYIAPYTEGLTHADIEQVLKALAPAIEDGLRKNRKEKMLIPGVGSFQVNHIAERSGVSRLHGEERSWVVPEHDEITFKMSKPFKNVLVEE